MIRKKILFFLQDAVGGAERVSVLLGKTLPKEHYEVIFCLVDRHLGTSILDFIPEGHTTISIPDSGPLRLMWRLTRLIHAEQPHIVFSSIMYLNTKILPFRSLFPHTRFVVRCENYLYTFSKLQQLRIRHTYKLADTIIAQTAEMRDELIAQTHITPSKVVVLQNPVDTELIDSMIANSSNPYPQNGLKHFVAVGRLTYQKGFDLLLEAFIQVAEQRQDVDLYIVGDNSYDNGKIYKAICERVHQANISHLVHCVGYQNNPYPYIRYAHCFVLSSRWEGLPNVMIESLYLGTPAAAFNCIPIIERIVHNGVSGFLAGSGNVSQLSSAMINALNLGRINSSYSSCSVNDIVETICK